MIDLYFFISPNARKIHIALEELGLPYEIRWTDITRGDQFDPAFIEVNPNSKIPAIVDHDGPGGRSIRIFESGAILHYLAAKTGRLLPADEAQRWEATCWVFWQVANQGPGSGNATHFVKYAPDAGVHDEYARTRYVTEATRCYQVLENRLAGRDYLAGAGVGEFSIADIACFPWTRLGKSHGVALSNFPAVEAWSERIAARPSAQVKVEDQRDESAKNLRYTQEQRDVLFGGQLRTPTRSTVET